MTTSFRSYAEVRTPTKSMLITCFVTPRNALGNHSGTYIGRPVSLAGPALNDFVQDQPPHGGNTNNNFLFVDGHAKTYAPIDTIGEGTMETPQGMWRAE